MNEEKIKSVLLHHAAGEGKVALVKEMLSGGAPVGAMDNAAMRWALRHGHANIVEVLFDAGADVTENEAEFVRIALKNGDGDSLDVLSKHAQKPIFPFSLNDVDKAINFQAIRPLESVLHVGEETTASEHTDMWKLRILGLLQGSDADVVGQNCRILENDISSADVGKIKFLLEGAIFDPQSGFSMSNAIAFGNAEVIEVLLRAGAVLTDISQITIAHIFDSLEAVLMLDSYGYSWESCADELVAVAANNKAPRILKYVLEHKRVEQATLDQGLLHAIRCGVEDSVGTLMKYGANPTFSKSLPLKWAVTFGTSATIRIARKLIAAGALVTDLDSLHVGFLVEPEQWEFLRELLRHGIRTGDFAFKQDLAVRFFAEMQPQDLLNDRDGVSFPISVLRERDKFVRNIGAVAAQKSDADKIKVVEWLSAFFGELTTKKIQMRAAMNG